MIDTGYLWYNETEKQQRVCIKLQMVDVIVNELVKRLKRYENGRGMKGSWRRRAPAWLGCRSKEDICVLLSATFQ